MLTTLMVLVLAASGDPTQTYAAELEKIAPDAVADFVEAEALADQQDWAGSIARLQKVRQAAPDFAPAIRREAYARMGTGEYDLAVALADKSKALDDSFDSDLALAVVLSARKGKGDLARAERVIELALRKDPDHMQAILLRCEILSDLKVPYTMECFEDAAVKFPNAPYALFLGSIAAGSRGELSLGRERLERAHGLGLPDEQYNYVLALIDEVQPFYEKYWRHGLAALLVWGMLWVVLILAGGVLSTMTIREAQRLPTHQSGAAVGDSALLHKSYARLLLASVVFYYLSLPLVLLVVIGGAAALIHGFMLTGHLPIKLVGVVGLLALATVFAVVKSLFVKRDESDPGHKLDPSAEPALRTLLHEVAAKLNTRPIDNVYLTPGAQLAVMERGSMRQRLEGKAERCLILGVGVLDGMTQGQLRSVLAHEYGHFSNRDTAGGDLGLTVRLSLMEMARALAENDAAEWYNPAWLFLNGYHRVFLRISQGATRLQEVLADRWAAFAYGSENFAEGLTHAIRQGIRLDAHTNATLNQVVASKAPLGNFYAFTPSTPVAAEAVESQLKEAMEREPSPYDSHPRPADRITWVRALGVSMPVDEAARAPAWALFVNREALELKMTDEIRGNLAIRGIQLS